MPKPVANQPHLLSAEALQLLRTVALDPTPRNYAIWYQYAAYPVSPLRAEIDRALKDAVKFDDGLSAYFYDKYIAPAATPSTSQASVLLAELASLITGISGESENYQQEIDKRIVELRQQSKSPELGSVIEALLAAATGLKKSSSDMQKKLRDSHGEIEVLRKTLVETTKEAERDFLTGLFNRKAFDRLLDQLGEFAAAQKTPLSLLMIDIDHFKHFNDEYGHLIGDEVLKTVAKMLKDTLKGTDIVARFGGEEFVVLLPATPIAGARVVAENVRKAIASRELRHRESKSSFGAVTVSIGMAEFISGETIHHFIKRADEQLYISKKEGRNRVSPAAG